MSNGGNTFATIPREASRLCLSLQQQQRSRLPVVDRNLPKELERTPFPSGVPSRLPTLTSTDDGDDLFEGDPVVRSATGLERFVH